MLQIAVDAPRPASNQTSPDATPVQPLGDAQFHGDVAPGYAHGSVSISATLIRNAIDTVKARGMFNQQCRALDETRCASKAYHKMLLSLDMFVKSGMPASLR